MSQPVFKINVRQEQYVVEPVFKDELDTFQYAISTDCNYIMTIYEDDNGTWKALADVQVMDNELVNEIGSAIELNATSNNR